MKKFSEKQAGLLSNSDLKGTKGKITYWILFVILTLAVLVTVIPVIWMVLTAFKSTQEIYSSAAFFSSNFSFSIAVDRVTEAWTTLSLGRSMVNTLIVSVGNMLGSILICGLAGFVLSKKKVSGTKLIFILVIWTMMMPASIRIVSTYMSYISFPFIIDDGWDSVTNINILNTYWPLWLLSAADSFTIVLFKNNFDAISDSLVESAELDGCSPFKVFWKILLPIAAPVVFYEAITKLSLAWADYFNPYLIINDTSLQTTPARLFQLQSDRTVTMNNYMMGLIFACIPPFIIYVIFQRKIKGGMMMGAVKG